MTTNTVEQTLASLRDKVEYFKNDQWGAVYIDNARLPGQSAYEFRAHLSSLSRQGLYKPEGDDCFGYVRFD
jgi:hypothetical protein